MKIVSLLCFVLVIASCASNPASLRSSNSGVHAFQASLPLLQAFEKIHEQASNCNPGLIESTVTVTVGLLPVPATTTIEWFVRPVIGPDNKKAEIQYFNLNGGFESYMMVTDLESVDLETTNVITYYKFSAWQEAAANVEGWVNGTSSACWLK